MMPQDQNLDLIVRNQAGPKLFIAASRVPRNQNITNHDHLRISIVLAVLGRLIPDTPWADNFLSTLKLSQCLFQSRLSEVGFIENTGGWEPPKESLQEGDMILVIVTQKDLIESVTAIFLNQFPWGLFSAQIKVLARLRLHHGEPLPLANVPKNPSPVG
jgi:hypothetical protein